MGGKLAAYHAGSVVIDHVLRTGSAVEGLHVRFREFAELHAGVLAGLGLDVSIGEVPGEYCPGEFSLNIGGRNKVAGSAQRVTRDGWVFSTVIQVNGAERLREVLTDCYAALGYELDPSTVGALEDLRPGVSTREVVEAMLRAYRRPDRSPFTELDDALRGPLTDAARDLRL
jgi:lipoate-protein ligase A